MALNDDADVELEMMTLSSADLRRIVEHEHGHRARMAAQELGWRRHGPDPVPSRIW